MILVIERKQDLVAFRDALPILIQLLAEESVRVQAFLALAEMARHSEEGIDLDLLRVRAEELIQSPGPGQAAAAALLGREIETEIAPAVTPEISVPSDDNSPMELDMELLQQQADVFMSLPLGQLLCLSDSDRLVVASDTPDPPSGGVVEVSPDLE
jgi:hypothetical protein